MILTLPEQLVGLAHALLDQTLAVVQRLDAVGLDGVHLGQQGGQSLRQQPSGGGLQLGKVPAEGVASLTGAAADLEEGEGRERRERREGREVSVPADFLSVL